MYSHDWTMVLRIDTAAPPGVHPYALRGWCLFEHKGSLTKIMPELSVSIVAIQTGIDDNAQVRLPRLPEEFNEELKTTHFTNGRTDSALVANLYSRLAD